MSCRSGMRFRAGKHGSLPAVAGLLSVALGLCSGCAVPQKPGKGYCARLTEPETRSAYWLYLPEDYVANKGLHPSGGRWPMVVTFHGLRPYDDANPQIREWQEEADRYGFIVIAPELRTCDTLVMQLPLRDPDKWYVRHDEQAVLAIMDEVTRRTNADPSRVLATSFSSGGYMAHYMVNRHPERFTCLAVRGSNFSESLLNPSQVPKYRHMKIGIFFGENDLPICRDESLEAVGWYRRNRFDVAAKKVGGLGHERKPEVAAALFADTIGVTPKTPPDLGPLVMMDVIPDNGGWRLPPRTPRAIAPESAKEPQTVARQDAAFSPPSQSPPQPAPVVTRDASSASADGTAEESMVEPATNRVLPRRTETPRRPAAVPSGPGKTAPRSPERTRPPLVFAKREQIALPPLPASIRVHGEPIGEAPMRVSLSVDLPDHLKSGTSVLWTRNGQPIPALNSFETQVLLEEPGDHDIEAHIIMADDRKAVLRQTITVLGATTRPGV